MTGPVHVVSEGRPAPLGVSLDGDGVNVAVFSEHAQQIDLCLYDRDGVVEQVRLPLPGRTGDVVHGHVSGVSVGQRYGLRAHGSQDPAAGHTFNPAKLLMDPYARHVAGRPDRHPALYPLKLDGTPVAAWQEPSDSGASMPKAVVMPDLAPYPDYARPKVPWSETVIYEAHPRGLTMAHTAVPEDLRGTLAGLAHPAVVQHLRDLGVTALELLPVHPAADEPHLVAAGLRNYWGYNPYTYFAVDPLLLGPQAEDGRLAFRAMVAALHAAGIEVILDVVFNHTAEGGEGGPMLSFRGLDNAAYYRLDHHDPRGYLNDSGCGNTLDLTHPAVVQMVMDSLRYWVTVMGVDGFRFDLAVTLARVGMHGYDPRAPFLTAVRQDPVLQHVKLIAEPWDIGPGGYHVGGFPHGWSEWNDKYRDDVRRFWLGEPGMLPSLALRMAGSSDLFYGRGPLASVNFVTAHDGFTLADLVSYAHKHNEANGEDNRDGTDANHSTNHGAEGLTPDPEILAARRRHMRNLLATLMLSQGVPMLSGGDEVARSQQGNNNAYCQDNQFTWHPWSDVDRAANPVGDDGALQAFLTRLALIRRSYPALRRDRHLEGEAAGRHALKDIAWLSPTGEEMTPELWTDPTSQAMGMLLDGGEESGPLLILLNGGTAEITFTLPHVDGLARWVVVLDTTVDGADAGYGSRAVMAGGPFVLPAHALWCLEADEDSHV